MVQAPLQRALVKVQQLHRAGGVRRGHDGAHAVHVAEPHVREVDGEQAGVRGAPRAPGQRLLHEAEQRGRAHKERKGEVRVEGLDGDDEEAVGGGGGEGARVLGGGGIGGAVVSADGDLGVVDLAAGGEGREEEHVHACDHIDGFVAVEGEIDHVEAEDVGHAGVRGGAAHAAQEVDFREENKALDGAVEYLLQSRMNNEGRDGGDGGDGPLFARQCASSRR